MVESKQRHRDKDNMKQLKIIKAELENLIKQESQNPEQVNHDYKPKKLRLNIQQNQRK